MARIRLAWAFFHAFLSRTPSWLDTTSGRVLPKIAGADDGDDGGEGGDGGDDDGGGKTAGDEDKSDEDKSADDDDGKPAKTAEEYRRQLRQTERRSKAAAAKKDKELADLRKKLKDQEDKDKSEQQKALEKAREEGKTEALSEAQKERRADRLEAKTISLAAKGFKIEIDGKDKTVRFADPDDALVYVERAIAKGDVSEDDIFDEDNKVKADGLRSALTEILEEKPHLREDGKGQGKPTGDPDGGKGSGGGADIESMSADDHLKQIRRNK